MLWMPTHGAAVAEDKPPPSGMAAADQAWSSNIHPPEPSVRGTHGAEGTAQVSIAVDNCGQAAANAPTDLGSSSVEPPEGSLILLRLLALPGLKTLLLERSPGFLHSAVALQGTLPDDLFQAMQLLITDEERAPLLLRALLTHVNLADLDATSSSDWQGRACWQLLCHLTVESECCRKAILRSHTRSGSDDVQCDAGSSHGHGDALLLMVRGVEHCIRNPPADGLIFPALRALLTLTWDDSMVCLPLLHLWLTKGFASGEGCVFSHLIGPSLPVCARLEAFKLLELVLRQEESFLTFMTPPIGALTTSLGMAIALALSPRHATRTSNAKQRAREGTRVQCGRWANGLDKRSDMCSKAGEGEYEADGGTSSEEFAKLGLLPKQALQQAGLRLLSSLVANHADAAERLLSPNLGLALPMRLVAMLQSQVRP